VRRIPLSTRLGPPRAYALVDDEDFERFGHLSWYLESKPGRALYASRNSSDGGTIYLHRSVCGCTHGDGQIVDHRNGDGLDNRRANLRITTHAQNMRNRRPRSFGTSRYRGVYRFKRTGKWSARAKVNYQSIWLGSFDDEDAAGAAVEAFWREFDPTALEAAANDWEYRRAER
jgi:hypothetical protein